MNKERTLRFNINAKTVSGNFTLTLSPYIIDKIEQEINAFCYSSKKQMPTLSIQRLNNVYEINENAFDFICKIISKVLKENQ